MKTMLQEKLHAARKEGRPKHSWTHQMRHGQQRFALMQEEKEKKLRT